MNTGRGNAAAPYKTEILNINLHCVIYVNYPIVSLVTHIFLLFAKKVTKEANSWIGVLFSCVGTLKAKINSNKMAQ